MNLKHSSPVQQKRLYEMVAERILKDHVLTSSVGERLPTETEFAEIYHVSVPTVREALRSLVQAGHLHRRQGSGTYRKDSPVTSSKSVKNQAQVALISPLDLADRSISRHYIQLALQTSKCLKNLGFGSQIYFGETASDSERSFDDSVLCRDIEAGLVSSAVVISEQDKRGFTYLEALKNLGIPVLETAANSNISGKSPGKVFLESAVDALMRHGRRKIACIGFGAGSGSKGSSDFSRIVSSKGGVTDESWMIGDLHPSTVGSGYSLMREIWTTARIKPDGLVLCDDVFFRDTELAIRELGIKSPEQLLVVTYRNMGEQLFAPFPVIELQYDARVLAEQLASNVAAVLQGKPTKELIFEGQLVDPFMEDPDLLHFANQVSGKQSIEK